MADQQNNAQKIGSMIEEADKIYIVPHVNPDPDALASAYAWQYVVKRKYKKHAEIIQVGIIGREENKALIRECGIKLNDSPDVDIRNEDLVILVDTQPTHGNNPLKKGIRPDVVIDHHPSRGRKNIKDAVYDVRPHYGSSSSITYEYMKELAVPQTKKTATALFYGLKTDTANLTRDSADIDITIFYELMKKADNKALAKIERPEMPLEYFKTISKAFQRVFIYENIVVVHLQEVESADYASLIADFFLSYQNTDWVFVTARYSKKVVMSIRSKHSKKDAGELMRTLVGRRGSGGGHMHSAGGNIDYNGTEEEAAKIEKEMVSKILLELKGKVIVGELLLHTPD